MPVQSGTELLSFYSAATTLMPCSSHSYLVTGSPEDRLECVNLLGTKILFMMVVISRRLGCTGACPALATNAYGVPDLPPLQSALPSSSLNAAWHTDLAACILLQLPPQLVAAPQQGNIGTLLMVGKADDAGQAMGAAILVSNAELLNAEDLRHERKLGVAADCMSKLVMNGAPTLLPRLASWHKAAEPWPPIPTTMTSKCLQTRKTYQLTRGGEVP